MSKYDEIRQWICKRIESHLVFYIFLIVGCVIPLVGILLQNRYPDEIFSKSDGYMIAWGLMWAPYIKYRLSEKIEHSNRMSDNFGNKPKQHRLERVGEIHFSNVAKEYTKLRVKWIGAETLIFLFGTIIWTIG